MNREQSPPKKAMILAAGFGTRLWPLTIGRTKPAIPFLNRPLIGETIDYLRRYGVTDLIINLHHEPASVRDQIGDGSRFGVRIEYSLEEPVILGTAGALDAVRERLMEGTFVVINGKILTDLDLAAALATHRRERAIATLVLRRNERREQFREVLLDERGHLKGFGAFPDPEARQGGEIPLMFTGIHLMEPEIFEWVPVGVPSDSVRDVYPRVLDAGHTIAGHVASGRWDELSTLARYHSISLAYLRADGRDSICGDRCEIDPTARVERSILWSDVTIGADAEVRDCILGDGVTIPPGASFRGAAIVPARIVPPDDAPEKSLSGEIIGENLVVPFLE
jgi:NDP-sugar pyrophosphorylase family protein